LKEKECWILLGSENLGATGENNFRDKLGKEFRNINHTMNSIYNENKAGRARNADKIDEILGKALKK
jgi:hypothetical protein